MAEGGALAHGAQVREALLVHGNALHGGTDGEDLHHLLGGIGQGADDDKAVQQIHGDPVRRGHVRAADRAHAAVGREDHDGREGRLERPVEVGEALHVEHVHLVHKQHARDELSHPLVDVPVDHLVDLLPQLLRDLRLLRLHHLPHDRHDVLPTLRLGVGTVQVVQGHVLHDLLLLVHVALGQGYVLLRLQVVLGRIRVTPPHALHCPRVGLDINHIPHSNVLLLEAIVYRGVELELLSSLDGLEADHDVAHNLPVPAARALGLLGGELGDLALVHLLVLLDAQADGAAEVLHQNLRLLHLGRVHLGADHGAEGHLGAELLRDAKGQGGLARPGSARHEKGPSSHLLLPDHVHHKTAGLASLLLPHEPSAHGDGLAIILEAEALDMRVRGHTLLLGR
mmetsp:Transcript_38831/g.123452  ORF Transcript_38831/g.123452 Transcript_38831/m.123452 type:complete len:397 (+) Transcript_38831:329-1519(+)